MSEIGCVALRRNLGFIGRLDLLLKKQLPVYFEEEPVVLNVESPSLEIPVPLG